MYHIKKKENLSNIKLCISLFRVIFYKARCNFPIYHGKMSFIFLISLRRKSYNPS